MADQCVVFDLDDTLYKEIDFLRSGFRHIVRKLSFPDDTAVLEMMIRAYLNGLDAFEYIIRLRPDSDRSQLLEWYRCHQPDISLDASTANCLNFLRQINAILGLVTDGRSITQRNKIHALGLDRLIPESNIVISGELGFEKPSKINFLKIVENNPDCRYYYIGDNPAKDFITPNELGWTTVGILDNGQNIHHQTYMGGNYEPGLWINEISELIGIIYG